jgi:hypothetical protein
MKSRKSINNNNLLMPIRAAFPLPDILVAFNPLPTDLKMATCLLTQFPQMNLQGDSSIPLSLQASSGLKITQPR